jgi:hypothetical protein
MSKFGTSTEYNIVLLNMETLKYHKVTDFDMSVTHPPKIDTSLSTPNIKSVEKWITPWPEISFEKVNFPKYDGGVHQYLGEPSNKPDFIKDYHLIAIARNIDAWSEPTFSAYIKAVVNSVKSK